MRNGAFGPFTLVVVPLLAASSGCGGSGGGGAGGSEPVNVTLAAEYGNTPALPFAGASCPGVTLIDEPGYAAGDDCDNDGGVVSFLTPAHFTVALKRLTFVTQDGIPVDIVPDSETLANATRIDLATPVTISQASIATAHYVAARAEIYYFEISMPINNAHTQQTIRVYMSDDDFPSEGNLHHHQGDITLIDGSGTEMGWVGVNTPWTAAALQTDPSTLARPGAVDAETGHRRGHFGNSALWDQAAFVQGANQDIFILTAPLDLDLEKLALPTITFTFNVANSWFWEDFDADGNFDPCEDVNGEGESDACVASAEWAPLFNPPAVAIE